MKKVLFVLLITCILMSYTSLFATRLWDVALMHPPKWVNLFSYKNHRYAIEIRKLAEMEKMSLRDALEVQNHYYDFVMDRANRTSPEVCFQKALARVKNSKDKYEHVWKQENVDKAKFIIVFDLDDTLFNQYYSIGAKGPAYRDIVLGEKNFRIDKDNPDWHDNYLKFTPGWKEVFKRIRKLGGSVVLFTAKNDYMANKIYKKWMYDEKTHISEHIDGFLTKNHLTLVPGIKWNRGKAYPMKDMELIDPTLTKIIIVDDSPSKTYQSLHVRFLQEYNPDIHLADNTPVEIKKMYENLLKEVGDEIVESVRYMNGNEGVTFNDAYKPYSLQGRVTLDSLIATGISRSDALKLIRGNKDIIQNRF